MNYNSVKKIITAGIVSLVLGTVLTVLFTNFNYNNYVKSNNEAMLRLVSAFTEGNGLSKDEIIGILESDTVINYDILKEYGYTSDTKYFLNISQNNLKQNILINCILVDGIIFITFLVLIILQKNRDKKINKLILYLQELSNKNYSLEIDDSKEDELSKLKTELYRITVLLKEQAENSLIDKLAVKNNIIDISHQLKTPLTSMNIMLDNIIEYPQMDEKTKDKFILNIHENVLHMEFLLQNLLKLSKFDANVIEFKKDEIIVADLVENSLKNLKSIIDEKEISLDISGDCSANFVGDFKWQSEAISNIIKNSVEHSSNHSKIEISYIKNNFYSKITVKDFGKGIKPENIKKIFTRFYKDENSSEESVGVGLNLAKIIIEKDKGAITVNSVENEFTSFEIRYFR